MFRKFALAGDVSEPESTSSWCAEEHCGEDPVAIDEMEWEAGFKFVLGAGAAIEVDMRRRFDTGESCLVGLGT